MIYACRNYNFSDNTHEMYLCIKRISITMVFVCNNLVLEIFIILQIMKNIQYTNDCKRYIAIGFLKFLTQTIPKAVRYRSSNDGRNYSTIILTIKNWFTDFN